MSECEVMEVSGTGDRDLYFGYCTFIDGDEARHNLASSRFVAIGRAEAHRLEFRAMGPDGVRGLAHLASVDDFDGGLDYAIGVIYSVSRADADVIKPGWVRHELVVAAEDGLRYDCYTHRLADPGPRLALDDALWQIMRRGMQQRALPQDYVDRIELAHVGGGGR
jgi:hypothetical protein